MIKLECVVLGSNAKEELMEIRVNPKMISGYVISTDCTGNLVIGYSKANLHWLYLKNGEKLQINNGQKVLEYLLNSDEYREVKISQGALHVLESNVVYETRKTVVVNCDFRNSCFTKDNDWIFE